MSDGPGEVGTGIRGSPGSHCNGLRGHLERQVGFILRPISIHSLHFFFQGHKVKDKKQKSSPTFCSSPIPQVNSPGVAPTNIVSSVSFQKTISENKGFGEKTRRLPWNLERKVLSDIQGEDAGGNGEGGSRIK